MVFFIPYCSFFFSNLISHGFRAEFKRLTKNPLRFCLKKVRKFKENRNNNNIYTIEVIQRRIPVGINL